MNTTTSAQGWTPEAYLEEIAVAAAKPAPPPPPPVAPKAAPNGNAVAAAKAKPAPPAPPAKRPSATGRKPLAPPTRDSAVSINSQDSSGGASGRATPNSSSNASLAGGLAEILRQRQSAMRPSHEDDDDW